MPSDRLSRREACARFLATICLCSWGGLVVAQPRLPTILETLDTDDSGAIDLPEARIAAASLFDDLDRDGDGMLDARELGGRLSAKELAAWDPDADGILTKFDYLAAVEQRFKAADVDGNGLLTSKELRAVAGRALLRLLK